MNNMDNKSNVKQGDWMATVLSNQNTTVEDFIDNGVNSTNTVLQSRDYYKDKPKIKKMFSNSDGSFDERNYNKFYDQALKSYNDISEKTFNSPDVISKSFYEGSLYAPKNKPLRTTQGYFERVSNPTKETTGLVNANAV